MARSRYVIGAGAIAAASVMVLAAVAEPMVYSAEGFDEIDLSAGLSVVYERGDTFGVTAEFDRGGPDDVFVDVKGETLVITRKRTGFTWGEQKVRATFTVVSPALEAVEVSSGATFEGRGIQADAFSIDVSSGASVRLAGQCGDLRLDISSGASVDASELYCQQGWIEASSGASASTSVSEDVSVDASSGASVRVYGDPAVSDIDRSSGASVKIEPGAL